MRKSAFIPLMTGLLLILGSFLSCAEDKDDIQNCLTCETVYVTAVDAPSSAKLGQEVEVQLEFQVFNGCGQFHQFLETGSGTNRIIEVEAKYEGNICTQDLPIREVSYSFTPQTPGEYNLNFLTGEDEYENIIVFVEEQNN